MSDCGQIVLSTVFLNWNRSDLLQQAVESYIRTVTVKHEVVIIDNASTDGSQEIIAALCQGRPNFRSLFLPANEGGMALNRVTQSLRGQYFHFSENDLEYLPGWDKKVVAKFEAFPKLGQLSLFSPFRQPGEVWSGDFPARQMTQGNQMIYLAEANVGSSSVIRRGVWEKGVRWTNIESGRFKFPNDARYSDEVKQTGYDVAWSDEYLVINWGHNIEDIARRLPYYVESYQAKGWGNLDVFRRRLEQRGYTLIKGKGSYQITKLSELGAGWRWFSWSLSWSLYRPRYKISRPFYKLKRSVKKRLPRLIQMVRPRVDPQS